MIRRMMRALFPFGRFDRNARYLVFLMWLVGVLAAFATSHASSTIPFSRVSLGLSEGDMSLVLAVARFAGVASLLFSWWGDKAGRRKPFLVAFGILVLSTAATAGVETGWQFAALQAITRAAAAAVGTLAVVLIAEQVAPGVRAFAISLYGAGGSFGAGLALISLPLAELGPDGWRGLFALGALGLVALPLLTRGVKESPVFKIEHEIAVLGAAPLRDLLRSGFSRRLYETSAINLLVNIFMALTLTFSIERMVGDLGFATSTAVLLSLFGGTAGAIGFFLGGRMADTIGRRSTTIFSLFLVFGGGLALYWFESLPVLAIAIAVGTFGSFAFVPSAASHRTELFPTAFRTTANAAGAYAGMIGSAVGLLIGRFTIDEIGLSQTVLVLSLGIIGGIVLTLRLPETLGQELDRVGL
ncbi:MAG TPA: MFS transporter [Acidimicrobiia bacterium]|nr:MFS transporter [Acidimicrobiia bacterium]